MWLWQTRNCDLFKQYYLPLYWFGISLQSETPISTMSRLWWLLHFNISVKVLNSKECRCRIPLHCFTGLVPLCHTSEGMVLNKAWKIVLSQGGCFVAQLLLLKSYHDSFEYLVEISFFIGHQIYIDDSVNILYSITIISVPVSLRHHYDDHHH